MKKLIFLSAAVLMLASCGDRIRPSGNVITQQREVGAFTRLEVASGIKATVTIAAEASLEVTADDNVVNYIETYNDGDALIVKVKDRTSFLGGATVRVSVKAVDLDFVSASGGASVGLSGAIEADEFKVVLSGGSQFRGGDITAGTFTAILSGGSGMKTGGNATEFTLDCSGGSYFNRDGYGFSADAVNANLSGGSKARLTVGSSLDVVASGGSGFYYKGSPAHENTSASGGSTIRNVD